MARAVVLVFVATVGMMTPPFADGDDRYRHDDDEYSLGFSYGYRSPYWGPYWPGRGYYYPAYDYPGYYYPSYGPYRPGYGGSIGIGYHSGYYDDAFSLFFSLPLRFGPRYEPAPPAPEVLVPSVERTARALPGDCLQLREYQTEIIIDGEAVPAWGTACLQADGSWRIVSGPIADFD